MNSDWKTATIALSGTTSGAVDLERSFRSLIVAIPTISNGTLSLTVSDTSDGTYQALYGISLTDGDDDQVLCSTGTGGFTVVVPYFGFQHLKVVASAEQAAARAIKVCGFN